MPAFTNKVEIIPIPFEFFHPPPLTFTIGVMENAKDRELADHYVDFMTSMEGQLFLKIKASYLPSPTGGAYSLKNWE